MEELANYLPSVYVSPIPGLVVAALLSAATGIGSSVIGSAGSKTNGQRTVSAQKGLAEYQYGKDLEMWNRMNIYNAPTAQMQRLKQAGLNPRMIYGSGAASASGQASVMPKYQAPNVSYEGINPVNLMGVMSAYQNFQMRQAQIDNVKERTNTQQQITLIKDAQKMFELWKVGKATGRHGDFPAMRNYQQRIQSLMLRNFYQQQVNKMASQGVFQRDPLWLRYFNNILQNADIDLGKEIGTGLKN